jgi:hypothetical protein
MVEQIYEVVLANLKTTVCNYSIKSHTGVAGLLRKKL